jgi:diguanylate cyclase (GGDEF)-like protein/PAS domain S-box-containing protein
MLSLVSGVSPSQVMHYRTYPRDGRVLHCDWFMWAVFDDVGRLTSLLAFAQDVTARVRAEAEAAEREALFRATFEQAPVGIAHVGLDGRWLRVNHTLGDFFGHAPAQLLTMTFQQLTHPDDLDTDLGQLARLLAGEIDRYELRKRYLHADGHALWAQLTVSLRRDAAGRPLHFISVVEDIRATVEAEQALRRARDGLEARVAERTRDLESANRTLAVEVEQRRGAEAALRESEARLRTITDNVPALIGYIGADLRYRFNNAAYRDWFDAEPAHILGRSMRELLGDALFATLTPHVARVLAGEQVDFDIDYARPGGGVRHAHAVYTPAFDDAGTVTGFYVTTQDITVHRQLAQVLEQRALRDELTGLPNRAALAQALAAGAAQDSAGAAVMFLDLDGFKAVNDSHGHEVGDAVLREFARRLSASVRTGDLVARLSGDEFVVLLDAVDTPARAAEAVAGAILAAMEPPFEVGGHRLAIRSSIGAAVQAAGRFDRARLLRLADAAMYAAKRNAGAHFELIEA